MSCRYYLFHDGGHYHIETSPSICSANQWTGFYMTTASVMKELMETLKLILNQKNSFEFMADCNVSFDMHASKHVMT